MRLTVKNFGPIAEAKNIEVSPMTIFVGPSNTGKSYLATLIYSIYDVFADGPSFATRYFKYDEDDKDVFVDNLLKSRSTAYVEIDKYFSAWVEDNICFVWKNQFVYCFGEEGEDMLKDTESDKRLSVKIFDSENQVALDLISPENSKLTQRKKEDVYKYIREFISKAEYLKMPHDQRYGLYHALLATISDQFHTSLLDGIVPPHYLPATRGGIMQSYRTLVSALIKRAPMAGLSRPSPIPLFNGVLSDFMQKLLHIESRGRILLGDRWIMRQHYLHSKRNIRASMNEKNIQSTMKGISEAIENHVLSGEIYIQKSEVGYPDFRYKFKTNGKEHNVPLMSASSSVSELAPISLFIRHYLDAGDLFIVEEPEAHLHPGNQRNISDVLVQLVNAGVNVLITTHSDVILEQVSNFVYAADIPESEKTKLDEEKCSVYLFISRAGKTTVEKKPFDQEYGYLTKDHLDVSSELYNETIRLMKQRDKANG